ncbi:transglycosylase domain-containing protein [Clostridium aestuarii]|uniref:Penicillin-binding protein 1A n=1 Tax=Clostridium aestuarii TaxID=338193 RepID=A0ABT4CX67_9CLOT|nr:transglycosylase domain-containing protein [Clostridium aestuarii]MCY6483591.1 transglycosylase domain-containing protein [Clostridium aestuarii]
MPENKKSRTNKKKKKKKFKALKLILLIILILGVLATVAAGGIALAMIKTAPDLNINQIVAYNEPSKIYDDKGNYMDTIITEKKRSIIKYENMPKNLINAFISIEDERFFEHKGIDPKRIIGAFVIDVKNIVTGKKSLQGASTITQQLLKNTLFDTNTKNLNSKSKLEKKVRRKVQEIYLAPKLEKMIGKKAVMEAYLNTIYLGGRAIGVEAASQQYFNTTTKNLTLLQCAFLAGLPKSPSVYYPYSRTSRRNPEIYKNRTRTVLKKMLENGCITTQQHNDATKELNVRRASLTADETIATLGKSIIGKPSASDDKYNFEWFSRPVVNSVRNDLKEKYNYSDNEIDNLLVNGSLKIYSTMDRDLQISTQKILDDNSNLRVSSKKNEKGLIEPQASAVLVDYHIGQVKVLVGGRGEQPAMSYNRAINATIPCGSSIKPLTVYGPAIDTKIATAATVLEDSPLPDAMGRKYNGGKPWDPKNSPPGYAGYLNLRNGLKASVNIFAVKLEDKIGLDIGAKYGEKFGLTLDNVDKNSMSALALGELHHGTNTYTMANAYGVFGNNGLYTEPRLYTKVVDNTGKVLLESKIETRKVLSPQAAYIMYDLLKEPIQGGTGYRAKLSYKSNVPIGGKTGSTSNLRNLWFCGLTPYYSGSVWIDNKNHQRIYSSDAAYIFGKIMNEAVKGLDVKDITPPSGITSAAVDRISGLLPTALSYKDPRGSTVYTELFIKGTVPATLDNIHVEGKINKNNNKLATPSTPSELIESRVFIKRDYIPSVTLRDQHYVLPKEYDDTVRETPSIPEDENNNTDNENNTSTDLENTNTENENNTSTDDKDNDNSDTEDENINSDKNNTETDVEGGTSEDDTTSSNNKPNLTENNVEENTNTNLNN